MFLIVIAAIAFMMFNQNNRPQNSESDGPSSNQTGIERGNVDGLASDDEAQTGHEMPTRGRDHADSGWGMEDVDKQTGKSAPKSTRQGDWSLEEVDSKKDSDVGVRLSKPKEQSKSSRKSDWSMEDVDSKSKKKSDWELEEVDK